MAERAPDLMVVTVTPTIMDGTVVRWYWTKSDAESPGTMPLVSASRNGVRVNAFLDEVPNAVMETAQTVYVNLRRDQDCDMKHLATHRRRGLLGPLEPVAATKEATRG